MRNQQARISARLTAEERQRIEQLIAEGKFKNLTDFLRTAIKQLLDSACETRRMSENETASKMNVANNPSSSRQG